jgi:hypothetical protein
MWIGHAVSQKEDIFLSPLKEKCAERMNDKKAGRV